MSDVDQRFAPPNAHVEDVAVVEGDAELASRGMRFLASVIDVIVSVVVSLVLDKIPLYESLDRGNWFTDRASLHPGMVVSGLIVFFLVEAWLLVTRGQTVGKMICGMRIVRSDGSRADPWHILALRNGPTFLSQLNMVTSLIFSLADCLLIFRESRKCLHDTIADTKVIKL